MNVIGREINTIKKVTNLQATLSDDGSSLKGNVIYMIIWKCCYYFKKYFIEVAKGRPYELF
jgi:hypothetical protein